MFLYDSPLTQYVYFVDPTDRVTKGFCCILTYWYSEWIIIPLQIIMFQVTIDNTDATQPVLKTQFKSGMK